MDREKIIQEAKAELERHVWGTFVEGKTTVALGGTGVVVSGCEVPQEIRNEQSILATSGR